MLHQSFEPILAKHLINSVKLRNLLRKIIRACKKIQLDVEDHTFLSLYSLYITTKLDKIT
jgi:hypothetical protein